MIKQGIKANSKFLTISGTISFSVGISLGSIPITAFCQKKGIRNSIKKTIINDTQKMHIDDLLLKKRLNVSKISFRITI